jgi:hypothetical protein
MNKLILLSKLIQKIGLTKESTQIISLSSELKRLQLAERSEEPLGEIHPRDIGGTDKWMMTVAHDVAEILGLHTPAFLGSSARSRFGRGAYAFSVSNDAGESLILKIGLSGEISPYQKAMRLFGDDPPSVIPKIYAAGYFDDIGYKPPVDLANSFGYIVMEELEPMPGNMAGFLQELGGGEESFRILKDDKNELRRLINSSVERIRPSLFVKLNSPLLSDDEVTSKVDQISSDYKEELWNKSNEWVGSKNRDEFMNLIYHDFYHVLLSVLHSEISKGDINTIGVNNLSERAAAGFLGSVNVAPVESSYVLNTPLGNHFRMAVRELEDLGIDPADLHADNIMMRPGTGEIVISDLGHFSFGLM